MARLTEPRKTRRRARGEGTIYYHKGSGLHAGEIIIDGRKRTVYAPTPEAVAAKLAELRRQAVEGVLPEPNRVTVREWCERWLRESAPLRGNRDEGWAENTRNIYANALRYVTEAYGNLRLTELTGRHLDALYVRMREQGLSIRQCEIVHQAVGEALRAAMKARLVGRDVTKDVVNPPRARYGEPVALEPEEMKALLEAAWGTRWAVAFQLAVEAGLSRGELLGLQWRHVDLERGELRVVQQVQRSKGRGLVVVPLKSPNRRRALPLTPAMLAALREWRAALARAVRVETLPPDAFVFPAATRGYEAGRYDLHDPTSPETVDDAFRRYADRAGLKHARFHDLRHTTASWLAAAGVDPATAAKILGHTPRTMLLHYLKSMRKGQTVARDVMASWWEQAAPGNGPSSERDAQKTGTDDDEA